jgi:hypothetical protein
MDKLGRGNRDLRRAHHRDELASFRLLVALEGITRDLLDRVLAVDGGQLKFHVELLELVGLNLRRRDPVLHVG